MSLVAVDVVDDAGLSLETPLKHVLRPPSWDVQQGEARLRDKSQGEFSAAN